MLIIQDPKKYCSILSGKEYGKEQYIARYPKTKPARELPTNGISPELRSYIPYLAAIFGYRYTSRLTLQPIEDGEYLDFSRDWELSKDTLKYID